MSTASSRNFPRGPRKSLWMNGMVKGVSSYSISLIALPTGSIVSGTREQSDVNTLQIPKVHHSCCVPLSSSTEKSTTTLIATGFLPFLTVS